MVKTLNLQPWFGEWRKIIATKNVRGMKNDPSCGDMQEVCCSAASPESGGRKQEMSTEKSSGSCAPLANKLGEVHQVIEQDNMTFSSPIVNFPELLCLLELDPDGEWKI